MLKYNIFYNQSKGSKLESNTKIVVDHNIELYDNEMKYQKENKLMGEKYFDYISEYSIKHDNFLELGIGFGDTVRLINSNYSNVVVLDAEEVLINQYSTLYPEITFVHTYFDDYISNQKFDNIGIGFVLDLVNDPVGLLKKYADILTNNGKIYLSIGNASSLHLRIAYNAGLIDDMKKISNVRKGFNHQFSWTYDDLIMLFQEAGLKIVAAHGLMIKSFSTTQLDSLELNDKIYKALGDTARNFPEISNACFFVLANK